MKATIDEYIEIARQAKTTHKQLLKLVKLTTDKIPEDIINHLYKMQDYYFLFKDIEKDT